MPLAVSGFPESRLPPTRRFREHVGARQRKGNGQVSGFIQEYPSDRQPGTERTDVYLGYDSASLYLVWVCLGFESARGPWTHDLAPSRYTARRRLRRAHP